MRGQNQHVTASPARDAIPSDAIDVFIGGLLDRSSRIVASYRKYFRTLHPHRTTFYFEHDQCSEIVSSVVAVSSGAASVYINLVGHSWGAVTAIKAANELARQGIKVDKVITIDPVARKRVGVMSETTTWINVNAAPAESNGLNGDYYAAWGGKWDDWPRDKATVHHWAPYHHNEFASLLEYVALDSTCALHCLLNAGPKNESARH